MTRNHNSTINFEDYMNLPCHVYIKDTKSRIIECNNFQADSIGLKSSSIIGRTDRDFLENEAELTNINNNDQQIIKVEKSNLFIETATFNHVLHEWVSFKNPFRNQRGKVIGIFGISIQRDLFLQNPSYSTFMSPNYKSFLNHRDLNFKKLSKRELECLECLKKGMTAKKIAHALNLSPRTIEFYIENMKKKLNCANRIELVSKAMELSLAS